MIKIKKLIFKEWEDRGIEKIKISFQKEGEGIKEAIIPKTGLEDFIRQTEWF